jgi:hypothetical protein
MWCKSCRQDVPGIASTVEGHYCCARCAEVLLGNSQEDLGSSSPPATSVDGLNTDPTIDAEPPLSDSLGDLKFSSLPSIDDWELDEQLKHVERLLATFRPPSARQNNPLSHDQNVGIALRVDASDTKATERPATPTPTEPRRTIWSSLVWLTVAASWTALACGGALTGWGWYIHRDDFWNLGLPILFGGQLGLLVGLMFQLLITVRGSDAKQATEVVGEKPVPPASHTGPSDVDQRLARMQRQIDGFTQRFDPSGR